MILVDPKLQNLKDQFNATSREILRLTESLHEHMDESWNDDERKLSMLLHESAQKLVGVAQALSMPPKGSDMLQWQHDMRSPIASLLGASGVFLEFEENATSPRQPTVAQIWELAARAERQLQALVDGNRVL